MLFRRLLPLLIAVFPAFVQDTVLSQCLHCHSHTAETL
jgi:hypothetical protein